MPAVPASWLSGGASEFFGRAPLAPAENAWIGARGWAAERETRIKSHHPPWRCQRAPAAVFGPSGRSPLHQNRSKKRAGEARGQARLAGSGLGQGVGQALARAAQSLLHLCSLFVPLCVMERLTPPTLAATILDAPAWAQLGLAVRDPRMRERAAQAVAAFVIQRLEGEEPIDDRQLALPIG